MRGSRFSEEQIIGVLREHEGRGQDRRGLPPTRDLERDLLQVESKYGGLEVCEARRLKALEEENRRLKKLLAESMLDNAALKDLLGKNV